VDSKLEVIRDEMEETRANLANKLEALETQVRQTVSSASETVSDTVEDVKAVVGNVTETVGNVTETLNISKHVEQNPWVAMGIAVAAGFVAAQVFSGRGQQAPAYPPAPPQPPQPATPQTPSYQAPQSQSQPQQSQGGILGSLESMMPDMNGVMGTAITGLSGLAIGTVMGVVREFVADAVPQEWKSELTRMIDDVNTKLGGKTLQVPTFVGKTGDEQHRQDQPRQDESKQDAMSDLSSHGEAPTGSGDEASRRKRNNRNPVGSAG
jgi:ElaB/YqjD/DUF883 family membrane-anchored ribosome-binding protein